MNAEPTGRKEIKEAVIIACLGAIGAECIVWGFEEIKSAIKRRREKHNKSDEGDNETS